MSLKISALVFVVVFLLHLLPIKVGAELATPVKEAADGGKTLEQIQTALDINCAAGNILACVLGAPGTGVSIFKEIGRIFKGEDTFKDTEILFRQAAIIEATKDSCINIMGSKNRADLFFNGLKVECIRIFDPRIKDIFWMEMAYSGDSILNPKIRRSYSLSEEKDKSIAKNKCLQAIGKSDLEVVEYKDLETGINYKFSCTRHFVGEDKFTFLRIGIIKNNVRNPMMVFYPVLTKESNKP